MMHKSPRRSGESQIQFFARCSALVAAEQASASALARKRWGDLAGAQRKKVRLQVASKSIGKAESDLVASQTLAQKTPWEVGDSRWPLSMARIKAACQKPAFVKSGDASWSGLCNRRIEPHLFDKLPDTSKRRKLCSEICGSGNCRMRLSDAIEIEIRFNYAVLHTIASSLAADVEWGLLLDITARDPEHAIRHRITVLMQVALFQPDV
jgi:hypothetical protein